MGGRLSHQKKSDVVILIEKNDDRIVLVEQMWKYKKDLTRFLGIQHAYVVTTTMSGKKTKRDLILDPKKQVSSRVCTYDSNKEPLNMWKRVKVEPKLTESQLQEKLSQMNNEYDVTVNNCWHYSNTVLSLLEAKPEQHPYLVLLNGTKSLLSPFLSEHQFQAIGKSVSQFMAR